MWAVEVHGGRLFSASADKTIRVWNVESRRCEQVMEDHTRPVLSLAISNGKIYSGSYDYSIKVCVLAPHGAVWGSMHMRFMVRVFCPSPWLWPP